MILSFLYFVFPACAMLLYGLGTSSVLIVADELPSHTMTGIKSLSVVISSTILTYLFTSAVLSPASLSEFYPFAALLIFLVISIMLEVIIRITTKQSTSEFTVSFLVILLAAGEATSLPESIFIALSCSVSFYLLSFMVYLIKRRVRVAHTPSSMMNPSLVFLTMAFLMIIMCVLNVSYLNPGVLR